MKILQIFWGENIWAHIMLLVLIGTAVFTSVKCIRILRRAFRNKRISAKAVFSALFLFSFAAGLLALALHDIPAQQRADAAQKAEMEKHQKERQQKEDEIRRRAYRDAIAEARQRLEQKIAVDPSSANNEYLLQRFVSDTPSDWIVVESGYPLYCLIGNKQKTIALSLAFTEQQTSDAATVARKYAAGIEAANKDFRILKKQTVTFNNRAWETFSASFTHDGEQGETLVYIYSGPEGIVQMAANAPAPALTENMVEVTALMQTFNFREIPAKSTAK